MAYGPLDGPQEGVAGRGGHPDGLVPPPALTGAREAQVYLQLWLTAQAGGQCANSYLATL